MDKYLVGGGGQGAVETGCQGGQGSPRAVVPGGWMDKHLVEGGGQGAVETGCQGGQGSPRAVAPGGWMDKHLVGPLCLVFRINAMYSVNYSPLLKPLAPYSTHCFCCAILFGLVFLSWCNSPSGTRPPNYRGFIIKLSQTHHSRQDSSGRVISAPRSVPGKTQTLTRT